MRYLWVQHERIWIRISQKKQARVLMNLLLVEIFLPLSLSCQETVFNNSCLSLKMSNNDPELFRNGSNFCKCVSRQSWTGNVPKINSRAAKVGLNRGSKDASKVITRSNPAKAIFLFANAVKIILNRKMTQFIPWSVCFAYLSLGFWLINCCVSMSGNRKCKNHKGYVRICLGVYEKQYNRH